jgi:hypothetical protein
MPPQSYRTLQPEPPRGRRPVKIWDLVLSVVLLVLLILFSLGASYAAVFLAFAADACTAATCDYDVMNVGFWFAVVSPWVVLLLAAALTIVQLVRRRVAFWIPLVAAVLEVGLWFVAAAIVGSGVIR